MTLHTDIANCDPWASSPADFRRLFLRARAMRDEATTLSERATAEMLIRRVSQLVETRAHGTIDLSNPRASEQIAARQR